MTVEIGRLRSSDPLYTSSYQPTNLVTIYSLYLAVVARAPPTKAFQLAMTR